VNELRTLVFVPSRNILSDFDLRNDLRNSLIDIGKLSLAENRRSIDSGRSETLRSDR